MRIRELANRSGVTAPTIKYYVREGLLSAGERLGPVRTEYSEEHLARLRLIRALRENGKLSVEHLKHVLERLDAAPDGHRSVGAAMEALVEQHEQRRPKTAAEREELTEVRKEIDEFLVGLGWKTQGRHSSAERSLAEGFATLRRVLSKDLGVDILEPYARALEDLAKVEVAAGRLVGSAPADAVRRAFLGIILFEPILLSLRRLALEAQARKAYRQELPSSMAERD